MRLGRQNLEVLIDPPPTRLLDSRLDDTDPGTLETVAEFKNRADNAVRWLNNNKKEELLRMVESMPRRFAEAIKLKGARTGY